MSQTERVNPPQQHRSLAPETAGPAAQAMADHRPQSAIQRAASVGVQSSPAMVAQRQALNGAFGSAAIQRAAPEEELQMKPIQKAGPEEELQMKPIQKAGADEEELQMKPMQLEAGTVQREPTDPFEGLHPLPPNFNKEAFLAAVAAGKEKTDAAAIAMAPATEAPTSESTTADPGPALAATTTTDTTTADAAGAPEPQHPLPEELAVAQTKSMNAIQMAGQEEELLQGKAMQLAGPEEELQMKAADGAGPAGASKAQAQDSGGMPGGLKAGIEQLGGQSLDGVQVHRDSSKPAEVGALAYAQGTDIHLGPGQEQHLPHEAWHVVQQKQGRVQPTLQGKEGVQINDDAALEREADVMGAKALQRATEAQTPDA